jgi:hypothetical protein
LAFSHTGRTITYARFGLDAMSEIPHPHKLSSLSFLAAIRKKPSPWPPFSG